jgi:uncharacterized protein (TIGR02265 family)
LSASYELPDFRAPIHFDAVAARTPARATAKGFYFRAFLRELAHFGHHLEGFGRYRDFSDYPLRDGVAVLRECATRMYGGEPPREGLRRLGWVVFPTLLSTMVGRVVFGALGNDMQAVARNAPSGFEVSLSHGRCQTLRVSERESELRVTNFHLFPESFLVGVLEGSGAHYGHEVVVKLRQMGEHDYDFLCTW